MPTRPSLWISAGLRGAAADGHMLKPDHPPPCPLPAPHPALPQRALHAASRRAQAHAHHLQLQGAGAARVQPLLPPRALRLGESREGEGDPGRGEARAAVGFRSSHPPGGWAGRRAVCVCVRDGAAAGRSPSSSAPSTLRTSLQSCWQATRAASTRRRTSRTRRVAPRACRGPSPGPTDLLRPPLLPSAVADLA